MLRLHYNGPRNMSSVVTILDESSHPEVRRPRLARKQARSGAEDAICAAMFAAKFDAMYDAMYDAQTVRRTRASP